MTCRVCALKKKLFTPLRKTVLFINVCQKPLFRHSESKMHFLEQELIWVHRNIHHFMIHQKDDDKVARILSMI